MKPPAFDYVRAGTVDEALEVLARYGSDARVLAGGQTLMAMLNMRLLRPSVLVDIAHIPALREIEDKRDALVVDAGVTQAELLAWPGLAEHDPLLAAALPWVGHAQTRNAGTVCGSVAHADPSAEIPLVLVALDGQVHLRSRRRARNLRAVDFFLGTMTTTRADDEMIVAVSFPRVAAGTAFREVGRRHGDFAIVACVAVVTADKVRLAVGGVADRPVARDLEGDLDQALDAFAWDLEARDDIHATARYRRELVRRMGRQVIEEARQRFALGVQDPPHPKPLSSRQGGEGLVPASTPRPLSSRQGGEGRGEVGFLGKANRHRIQLTLNGAPVAGEAEPRLLLSDFLRHVLGATGTHVGCEHGVCGACTVQVDGRPRRACLMLAAQADGADVRTVEGLAPAGKLTPLQDSFRRNFALQCGFCTAGMLMSLDALFRDNPKAGENAVKETLAGHLCRCTGYASVVRAALDVREDTDA